MYVKVIAVVALIASLVAVANASGGVCTGFTDACAQDFNAIPPATSYVPARSFFNSNGFKVGWTSSRQYDSVSLKYRRGPSSSVTSTICDYTISRSTTNDGTCSATTGPSAFYNESATGCDIALDSSFGSALVDITNVIQGDNKCFEGATSTAFYKTYSTTVQIVEVQNQPSLRPGGGTHPATWVSYKDLSITFPILYNVSFTSITAFSAVDVKYDFRFQSYNPPSQITLRIFTSVQYPYQLSPTSSSVAPNTNLTAVTGIATSDAVRDGEQAYTCASTLNAICEQLWEVNITLANSACVFSGSVTFNYNIICRSGFTGDCAAPSPATFTATITIQSDNVCAVLIENVQVTGTLTSYQDSALASPMTNFVYSHQAYFKAVITGPSITNVAVQRVMIDSYNRQVILTTGGSNPTNAAYHSQVGTDSSKVANAAGANIATFDFNVNSDTFSAANQDNAQTVSVTAEIKITFANLNSVTRLMRFKVRPGMNLQAVSSQNNEVSAIISVSPGAPAAATASGGAAGVAYIVGGVVGGVFLVGGLVGLVAYRVAAAKRRSQSERQLVDAPLPKISDE